MTIGQRMKMLRENRSMTQVDVAKKVGVAVQTIFKYENEIITNIPLDKLEKIAYALDTTPAYLMGWEEKPAVDVSELSENDKELIEMMSELPDDKFQQVLDYVKFLLSQQ